MKHSLRALVALFAFAGASAALAMFHLFQIEQIYSNADGTVQFVVLHEVTGTNGENVLAGQRLTSTRRRPRTCCSEAAGHQALQTCRRPRSRGTSFHPRPHRGS